MGHSDEAEAIKGDLLADSVLSTADLGPMRSLLTGWAAGQGLDANMVHAVVLSGYEVLANSVEHGYREHGGRGPVEMYASRTDDLITLTVVDHGRWRTPPSDPGFRGRGLDLVRGLSSHIEMTRTEHGTTVTMTWVLTAG